MIKYDIRLNMKARPITSFPIQLMFNVHVILSIFISIPFPACQHKSVPVPNFSFPRVRNSVAENLRQIHINKALGM